MRLDPSHFYDPALPAGKRERGREQEEKGRGAGGKERAKEEETGTKEDRTSSAFLFPLLSFVSTSALGPSNPSPARRRPTQPSSGAPPSSFELPAFCGGSTTSRRSDARRGLVGSHATLPKRYLTWPAVSFQPPPSNPPTHHANHAPLY